MLCWEFDEASMRSRAAAVVGVGLSRRAWVYEPVVVTHVVTAALVLVSVNVNVNGAVSVDSVSVPADTVSHGRTDAAVSAADVSVDADVAFTAALPTVSVNDDWSVVGVRVAVRVLLPLPLPVG